ncbi:TRAP transporter small permease [Alphaproteobacteria bacterium KMM 3653]|uniref:TRAP transporter small permease protein n=1 Tax=Harenicola maris TaxID=2841044 RepID=A0AAP2CSF5_9RHOB|nr:TRAP transporter small permease [Harenicola maris]
MTSGRPPMLEGAVKGPVARAAVRGTEMLAAGLMGSIVLLVLANALGRYLFDRPLPWSEEIVMTAMIWVASVGIVLGIVRGSLICCDVLVMRLPVRLRRMLGVVCGVLGGLTLAFFAMKIGAYLSLFGADVTPILRMPKGLGIAALMLSMAGMAAVLLFRSARAAFGGSAS